MLLILREDGAQVRFAEDQRPVEDLAAQRTHEPVPRRAVRRYDGRECCILSGVEDPFDFQALRIQQPGKLLPDRANYEIFNADRQLLATVTETEGHTRLPRRRHVVARAGHLRTGDDVGPPVRNSSLNGPLHIETSSGTAHEGSASRLCDRGSAKRWPHHAADTLVVAPKGIRLWTFPGSGGVLFAELVE